MRKYVVSVVMLAVAASLAGCSVNTKMVTRERVDQDLSDSSGNRGYLMGTAPSAGERKTTREYLEVQVEVPSVEKENRVPGKTSGTSEVTNYEASSSYEPVVEEVEVAAEEEFADYKVQNNDTLQKISMKFYGTTKKWKVLFNANKDILKSPDRLRPGMTIRIPKAGAVVVEENEYIK